MQKVCAALGGRTMSLEEASYTF